MVPNAYGAIWCDVDGGSFWADMNACDVMGIAAEGALPDIRVSELLAELSPKAGEGQRYFTFRNHKGHVTRARMVPAPGAQTVILVDDLEDITTRFFQLKGREREYRELFENAQYGIYLSTVDGQLLHANPALVRLCGYDTEPEMLEGMKNASLQTYVDLNRHQLFVDELRRNGKVVDFVSEVRHRRTGERSWISETAWLVHDEAGTARYLAGTVIDVTGRMKHLERVETAAETDALTGLANRACFYDQLERCVSEQGHGGITLFLIDCDRFKDINDIYGHARGDAVLRICAGRLRAVIPQPALLARLGGDEFAILTKEISDRSSATDLARRIIDAFEQPIALEGANHRIGASIGIARFPDHALTARDMLRNADLALYAVKAAGRGDARLFDEELDRIKRERLTLENDLRDAHLRRELELFYQPVVNARAGRTIGLEALIRWRSPSRGLVNPGAFIEVAEDSGLMLAFGEWAIHEACRHAATLPDHITVAVNISALQFRSTDLAEVVSAALAAHQLEPRRLELEVTESVILKNETATFHMLGQLRSLGVKIALDDFGTGYSTLSYLQHFTFDKVKIDQSFVRSIKTNAVNRAVTRAVLSIGRDLGLDVVAEGIETDSELQALMNEGCDLMQGYYFGAPQPFTDIATGLALETLGQPAKTAGRAVA